MKIDLSKEQGALVPLYFFRKRDRLRLTEDRPLTLTEDRPLTLTEDRPLTLTEDRPLTLTRRDSAEHYTTRGK